MRIFIHNENNGGFGVDVTEKDFETFFYLFSHDINRATIEFLDTHAEL